MEHHSPTYLADPVWMQVPFTECAKRPIDYVSDCLAQAPAIFKEADRFPHLDPMEKLELANKLVSRCWDLDWTLQRCYEELRLTADGPLYWSVLSRNDNTMDQANCEKLFPVAYQFPNVLTASTLMMYWATLVVLWSGLCDLYQVIDNVINAGSAGGRQDHGLPSLGHRRDFISAAWHVCRSVEYCMQEEMMAIGSFIVASPLALVIGILRDQPQCQQEVAWMRTVLGQVRGRGLRIFEHIRL